MNVLSSSDDLKPMLLVWTSRMHREVPSIDTDP